MQRAFFMNLNKTCFFVIFCSVLAGYNQTQAAESSADTTKILLINSYHQGYEWTDLLTQAIRNELKNLNSIWEMAIEYMDTKHYASPEYETMLYDLYQFKYRHKKFDLIIVSDNFALDFIKNHRSELFGMTPVVFCGIDHYSGEMIAGFPKITGVIEDYDLDQTIDLILKLHPAATHIAVISNSSVIGRKDLSRALKLIPKYQHQVDFLVLENWDLENLPQKLDDLPENTIILRLAFSEKWDGTTILMKNAAEFWEKHCDRPTYTSLGYRVEHGVIGGIINTADLHGQAVGQLALQILKGIPVEKIPIMYKSPSASIFDYVQLEKFGIKTAALPPNSIIINKPFSLYREYKYLVWGVISAFCLLSSSIFFLILNILIRRRAQEALRENEKKYRVLIETLPNGIIEIDTKGQITFANSAFQKMFLYTEDELKKMTIFDFVSESRHEKIQEIIANLFEEAPKPAPNIDRFLTRSNEFLDIQLDWNYKRDFTGNVIGIISVVSNITQRIQAEKEAKIRQEQLIQADKMVALGILVSGVAHEINNPNNFIMLNIPTLNRTWNAILPILADYYAEEGEFEIAGYTFSQMREEFPKICSDILEGSRRIQLIVKDLKEYSQKTETEVLELVNINEMLRSCINLLSKNINKYTRNFQIQFAENLPLVPGNFQHFEQVVINLIQNSCQALRDHSEKILISTKLRKKDRVVIISIQDEGIGIPQQNLSRIFDPFFTTKRQTGGTGLGLSVSNSIITKYGGRLEYTSEPGKGTTAKIILPAISKQNCGNL